MCQECITIGAQIAQENAEVEEERIQESIDRIAHEMKTNPDWQELARREIKESMERIKM